MIQCHCLEEAEHGTQPFFNRCARIVIEDLLRDEFVVKGGRRDRGVGIRSKVAGIEAGHERRKELPLADRTQDEHCARCVGTNTQ
jgi:hypothetical protein